MNGRVYDPATARFMSADPSVPYATDIQSYDRYSYTRNNPLVMVDPSGFCDSPRSDGYVFSYADVSAYNECKKKEAEMQIVTVPGTNTWDPFGGTKITGMDLQDLLNSLGGRAAPSTRGGGGGGGGGGGAKPSSETKMKSCTGIARVLQGNSNHIGKPGAFSGDSVGIFKVTADSGVVIPSQFNLTKSGMRPYMEQISGTFTNGTGFSRVRDVMDDEPTRRKHTPTWTTRQFQQFIIDRETANNGGIPIFVVELPGASKDLGIRQITLKVPENVDCPIGTK